MWRGGVLWLAVSVYSHLVIGREGFIVRLTNSQTFLTPASLFSIFTADLSPF